MCIRDSIIYFLNYLTIDFFQSIKGYIVLKTALWYRSIKTINIKEKLFNNLAEVMLGENASPKSIPSNCPQRIQEDIKLSYLQRITVWVEYGISGLISVSYTHLRAHETGRN